MKDFFSSSRFKSFCWRAGAMMIVALLNAILESSLAFGLSTEMVVFLGLVLGEITKALNNYYGVK